MKNELRFATASVRTADGKGMTLIGQIGYSRLSEPNALPWREQILPGAFSDSLGRKIFAFWQHKSDAMALANTENESLEFVDGKDALRFTIHLDDQLELHKEVHRAVATGLCNGVSFGFSLDGSNSEVWDEITDENGARVSRRTLRGPLTLYEVSVVNQPCYSDGTGVQARSAIVYAPEPKALRVELGPQREPIMVPVRKMNAVDMRNKQRLAELAAVLRKDAEEERAKDAAIKAALTGPLAEKIRADEFQAAKLFIRVPNPGAKSESDCTFRVASEEELWLWTQEQALEKQQEEDCAHMLGDPQDDGRAQDEDQLTRPGNSAPLSSRKRGR